MTAPRDILSDEYAEILRVRALLQPNTGQVAWRTFLALEGATAPHVDISVYQPSSQINYAAAKAGGYPVMILRTGDGLWADTQFSLHWLACLAKGLAIQTYHFWRSHFNPITQADFIFSILEPLINALGFCPRVWMDCETHDNQANATILERLKAGMDRLNARILAKTGQKERVGLYSSPGFANARLTPVPSWLKVTTVGARVWQWLAHYTPAALPTQPTGWPVVNRVNWQQGIAGTHDWVPVSIPGFGTMKVDFDLAFMDAGAWVTWSGWEAVPPPAPGEGLQMTVTTDLLNVRSGPGTNYGVLYQIQGGEVVTPVDVGGSSAWVEIQEGEWACVQLNTTRFIEPNKETQNVQMDE